MRPKIFHLFLIFCFAGVSIASFFENRIDTAIVFVLITLGLLPTLFEELSKRALIVYLTLIAVISLLCLLILELQIFYRFLIGIIGLSALIELVYRILKLRKSRMNKRISN